MDAARATTIGAQSYARTDRKGYDAAVTKARQALGKIKGNNTFKNVEEAIGIVDDMGINRNSPEELAKINDNAFIIAYLRQENPQQIDTDWAGYFMKQFGSDTRAFRLEPVLENQ